ncbi:MAG TPA: hypothetical protein VFH42_08515 [Sporolactobacillaceae bacterium]|nr:hypothetical protein [Sporolactobacillaceae bacterium]
MGTSTIIKALGLFFLFFSIAIPGHAATQGQKIIEIHYIMNYPDHIQVQTVSNAHVISTEAFLEVNKGWHLVKSTNSEIYVEKEFTEDSPLSPLLTILRIKGNEPLTIERTGLFPINQINLFIQFENDPLEA